MNYSNLPRHSILAEWLNETPAASEMQQTELENEFESWTDKFNSFWQRNKSKAQKLGAVAGIIARLLSPGTPADRPEKPPIEQKAAADWQRTEDRRRRDEAANRAVRKPTMSGGDKELENTLLGEILGENATIQNTSTAYEMAYLVSELSELYDKLKAVRSTATPRAEALLALLEAESYDDVKNKIWPTLKPKEQATLKRVARLEARKRHFKNPAQFQPTGVEVHHWIPFKYADLYGQESTLEWLTKRTIPLDATSHALVGAAIDAAVAKNGRKKEVIDAVLAQMGEFKNGKIQLKAAYFENKDKNLQPHKGTGVQIGSIKNVSNFKGHFNIRKELELEAQTFY